MSGIETLEHTMTGYVGPFAKSVIKHQMKLLGLSGDNCSTAELDALASNVIDAAIFDPELKVKARNDLKKIVTSGAIRHMYGGVLHARVNALRQKFGSDGMQTVLNEMRKHGYKGPIQLDDIKLKRKYPVEYAQQMNAAIHELFGEEKYNELARLAARQQGIVGVFIKWAATLGMICKQAPSHWPHFYDFGEMSTESTDQGCRMMLRDAYVDELFCNYLTQYYQGVLDTANLGVTITHVKCVGKGDDICEWRADLPESKPEPETTGEAVPAEEDGEEKMFYTPAEVRDAILKCFIDTQGDEEMGTLMVKEQFKNAGADWSDPSKKDLYIVIDKLAEVSMKNRDSHMVMNNYRKIEKMLRRCG